MDSRSYFVESNFDSESINNSAQNEQDLFDEMTEGEALLGSVFQSCDVNNDGKVRVSRIVEYLLKEAAADDNKEILSYLDDLSLILDPTGKDILVDREMYQQGVHTWIEKIQSRSSFQGTEYDKSMVNDQEADHRKVNGVVYRGRGQSDQNMHAGSNGYNDSLGVDGSFAFRSECSNEWEKSQTEILGRIEELQITNQRLAEDNGKLQTMVETAEEANTSLTTEIDRMKKRLKKYEQLLEKSKAEEKEFEALKTTVSEYQLTRDDLISRASQLERENQALQRAVEEYQKADINRISAQQSLEEENRQLLQKLNEQKQLYAELEVLQDLKQKMVDESSSKSEHMTSFIAELSMANEALKAEKNRLEVDLLESRHEISKLTALTSPSSNCLKRQPIHASTPFQKNAPTNLQQEINAELVSPKTPDVSVSPKSRLSLQNTDEGSESRNNTAESDSSVATASSTDKYSTVAQQIAMNFKKKRDMALKHIADLADMDINSDSPHPDKALSKHLEEDLDAFSDKVQGIAIAKHLADKRSGKILETLKKVAVENQALTESRNKALQKINDISNSSFEMGERVAQLMEDIEKEKATTTQLKTANESLENKLKQEQDKNIALRDEIENLKIKETAKNSETNKMNRNESDDQIEELKSLIHEQETRIHEFTRKLFDLEELVEKKDAIISEQSEELHSLQNSCSTLGSKHEEELKQIIELFSNGGYMAETEETEALSFKIVKEKFFEYVAKMQAKIQNMGVRDGPVGSEGNDVSNNPVREEVQRTQDINRHIEIPITADNRLVDMETQTETVCYDSVCCETDLQMNELESALNAVALLKEIQNDQLIMGDLSDSQTGSEGDYGSRVCFYPETGGILDLVGVNGDTGRRDNEGGILTSAVSSHGNLQDCQFEEITGNTESGKNSRDLSSLQLDVCFENALDSVKDSPDAKDTGNITFDRNVEKLSDSDIDSTERHQNQETTEKKPRATRHRKIKPKSSTPRKALVRSESVSTDDSISFDEDAMDSDSGESCDLEPKPSESPAESEVSVQSASSKRARRIGISAEPVRLPTWSELRESFKLNQQILLEEEINSTESRKESIETEDIDGANVPHVSIKENNIDGHSKLRESPEGLNLLADSPGIVVDSMEWCYEFQKSNENDGVDVLQLPTKKRSVSFHLPEDQEVVENEDESETKPSDSTDQSIKDKHSPNSPPAAIPEDLSKRGSVGEEALDNQTEDDDDDDQESDNSSSRIYVKRDSLSKIRPLADKLENQSIRKLTESDKDLEKKFNNAVLTFRTDQYTLQKRLENQERARDVAETGMEREIRKLIDSIQVAEQATFALEQKESVQSLYGHADILRKAGMKVSAQAEQHGCFQQESKSAKMIEDLVTYAEHLRLCIERVNEAEELRNREVLSPKASNDSSTRNESDINNRKMKYAFCEKCNGRLTFGDGDSDVKDGFFHEEQTQEKSKEPALLTLASSVLRQRKKPKDLEKLDEINENEFQFTENFIVDNKSVNYAADLESHCEDTSRSLEPRRTGCSCFKAILRFFLSVAILSAILFIIANYVEVDLTLLSRNWNDKLTMYGKKFFNRGKKNAI